VWHRYNAKRASLVQSRIKALERIGTVEAMAADPEYCFEFPTPRTCPQAPIISFTDVSFGYGDGPLLFKNMNFGIDLDSRSGHGRAPNGIGKTTLLKLISGELKPVSGTAFRSPKVRMAVFSQHHVDGLDLSKSPLLYFVHSFPGVPEQRLRSHLGAFGLSGSLALQPMYTLLEARRVGLRSPKSRSQSHTCFSSTSLRIIWTLTQWKHSCRGWRCTRVVW